MIPGVMKPWQAQVHLLVVNLAPCLGEHTPTIKADGVRLGLRKTGAPPTHPLDGCVKVSGNKDTASKCGHTGLSLGRRCPLPRGMNRDKVIGTQAQGERHHRLEEVA